MAWNQGDTAYYDALSDRLLAGYEYTAKYNLGNNVSYDPGFYRCGANLVCRRFGLLYASANVIRIRLADRGRPSRTRLEACSRQSMRLLTDTLRR